MSLDRFHPVLQRWFSDTLGTPTPAQQQGWSAIRERRHTLIAAPTGSGKTLAAFLTALDDLFVEALTAPLPDEVRVVYVSPLKALSADIHKNLAEPRHGIRRIAEELNIDARITAGVRTGDTTSSERAAMLKTPPHILVTTPESLYLLLTAERSRNMLRSVRTVIVDEIHAVIGTRRGAHLALTLERLQHVAEAPLLRIGLSATQKPIEAVARYLTGGGDCTIVDEGHRRAMDLTLEVPRSPLEAVMSAEVWEEYYDALVRLIESHRTTLVFVNTRKMAERVARHLSDRLGEDAVTAHHGSLSKENRLDAETRLKTGQLKALVATASLELGIDIGHVDLVCQLGSPHRIATLLQRVGRSGHTVSGLPKGRVFPTSRDDLFECAALLRAVKRGELDQIVTHDAPLDVLAQQLVAESSCDDYAEDALFALAKRAWPYRALERGAFDDVVKMMADGFATKRGRRGALMHRDEVHGNVRGRRGSRLLALTSGGAIPEVADYRVVQEPDETFIGTLNEDFAIESNIGDVFQLGNTSWRVLQVSGGVVRVADAHGEPPSIPFWLGEAPARSDELSRAVSSLRADLEPLLDDREAAIAWLVDACGIPRAAAEPLIEYLAESHRVLGTLPTQQTLVLERFFDESGGMQLILHAPFGSRINKAWGLALRKRFCRQFDFELQAAATEDAILLSLGPQHSFPLADVFRYLHPATARDVLVQAFLDAPVWQTRWRWNATISLAVPRNRNGKKIAPQLQRTLADDLMAAVFPDAAACFENIGGDRKIPDHPLVNQAVRDCLEEAMDFDGLARVLTRIHADELTLVARDTPEPSPLAHEILNAQPYAFLDDAPLEERRTNAVYTRRVADAASARELGALDLAAIERVRDEERPDPRDADELHDALLTFGFLTDEDAPHELFDALAAAKRATRVHGLWFAAERLPELLAIHRVETTIAPPASRLTRTWSREEALVELLRGRLSLVGPATSDALASLLAVPQSNVDAALLALEGEGAILRGNFTPGASQLEWCDRRLLARIHRYTLNRLRAEIEPVTAADFTRFLFAWQHVTPSSRLSGIDGLQELLAQLDGFELAANAWERSVLPARMDRYDASMLDTLCFAGVAGWARVSPPTGAALPVGATPIALFLREHAATWQSLRETAPVALSEQAQRVVDTLRARGASFARELAALCELDEAALERALGELVCAGLVTSDGFAGLRSLVRASHEKRARTDVAGRWSLLASDANGDDALELQARTFLRRYGIVFRRLLARESNAAPWRELARVYRRMEARGDLRGGRFVAGMPGEQFALPDAVERLREIRRTPHDGTLVVLSAADPLNLTGTTSPGDRIRATPGTRIAYRDGVPVSVMEGDYVRPLTDIESNDALTVAAALAGRAVAAGRGWVGRGWVGR
ncbi:MAG: DEAD/DEAH box helicase [Acidobacteria bacterium]|nr:DEAD/DEAH box helicase [Acidobacteriota bacterium]MBV9475275.1 DEAD/DEAH box helicase [Acidobacteriota bacterium]